LHRIIAQLQTFPKECALFPSTLDILLRPSYHLLFLFFIPIYKICQPQPSHHRNKFRGIPGGCFVFLILYCFYSISLQPNCWNPIVHLFLLVSVKKKKIDGMQRLGAYPITSTFHHGLLASFISSVSVFISAS
jgi:hypothetical protein